MNQIKLALVSISLLVLTSCATHTGTISSSSINEEYIYEDMAFGISETRQYFGLGGLSKDALVLEAKRQLYRSRPLKQNESYANYSVDFKRTQIFFYYQVKVTVSADIVSKSNETSASRFSENYLTKLNTRQIQESLFEKGDSIINKKLDKGIIVGLERNNKFRVLYTTQNNEFKSKKQSLNQIYSINKTFKGMKPGENVKNTAEGINGTIVGVGEKGFIYQTRSGNPYFSKYFSTEPSGETK